MSAEMGKVSLSLLELYLGEKAVQELETMESTQMLHPTLTGSIASKENIRRIEYPIEKGMFSLNLESSCVDVQRRSQFQLQFQLR